MSSDAERRDEELDLAATLEKTAEEIAEEYYCKLWDLLDQLGICELSTNFPIPPESWKGIGRGWLMYPAIELFFKGQSWNLAPTTRGVLA